MMDNENLQNKSGLLNINTEKNTLAFGTGITYPFLCGNGIKKFISLSFEYARYLIKGERKNTIGVVPTVKTTKNLIPCIMEALNDGIYIFDCSRAYNGSEQRLGKAIKKARREDIFLITKIDDASQFNGSVEKCFEESLKQLDTDYVDLLLLHWPVDYPKTGDDRFDNSVPIYARSWKALEKIFKSGKAKAIGVSNFSIAQLKELKRYAEIMPSANEFECHPLCTRTELNDYCIKNGIQVFAYAALCSMDKRLINKSMGEIAQRHGKSIPQIILKWHMQKGRIPIFGTTKKQRVKEYSTLNDFTLSEDELKIIDSQNINYRAHPDSEHCDFTKGIWADWEKYKDNCP